MRVFAVLLRTTRNNSSNPKTTRNKPQLEKLEKPGAMNLKAKSPHHKVLRSKTKRNLSVGDRCYIAKGSKSK